jgi:hypothetical protein
LRRATWLKFLPLLGKTHVFVFDVIWILNTFLVALSGELSLEGLYFSMVMKLSW